MNKDINIHFFNEKKDDLENIPSLGPDGEYLTRTKKLIKNCFGEPVYNVSSVPMPIVSHWIETIKKAKSISLQKIRKSMIDAATLFQNERHLECNLSLVTGSPINVIKECLLMIFDSLRNSSYILDLSVPKACSDDHGERFGARWCRKGDIFFVQAAGNSPGVHALWLEALSLGYRVIVRPSSRDPLTPYYLILALYKAGIPRDYIIMVPCDYDVIDFIIEKSDYALVYGNQNTVAKFYKQRNVLVQGPGRSKLIVTSDADNDFSLSLAYEGVIFHGGTACTSTSVIFVQSDIRQFSTKLADMLNEIDLFAPWNTLAKLPAFNKEDAELIINYFIEKVSPEKTILKPKIINKYYEGKKLTFITPGVIEVTSPEDPLVSVEWPFACVCIAPYEERIIEHLNNSLVVSIASNDHNLFDTLINNPSISNVYKNKSTSWHDWKIPHDSFLSEFLMRTKGIIYEE
ncbi:TPA: aldehyde dehydrogenase family protein [Klebsiella variicola subsp. variicola]